MLPLALLVHLEGQTQLPLLLHLLFLLKLPLQLVVEVLFVLQVLVGLFQMFHEHLQGSAERKSRQKSGLTATTTFTRTNCAIRTKMTKKIGAMILEMQQLVTQSAESSQFSSLRVSFMMPFQLSPVATRNKVKKAMPKFLKWACSPRPGRRGQMGNLKWRFLP